MWICNHCHQEHAFTKTSDKANHSRWCTKNPKRNETENLGIAQQKNMIQKFGPVKNFIVECERCKKEFSVREREKFFPVKER